MQNPDHLMPPSRRRKQRLVRWYRRRAALRLVAGVMLALLGAGLAWVLIGGR